MHLHLLVYVVRTNIIKYITQKYVSYNLLCALFFDFKIKNLPVSHANSIMM